MKISTKLLTIMISLIVLGFIIFSLTPRGWKADLINPMGQKNQEAVSNPTPAPPQAPQQFKFDRSTDLMRELESINPQVLDSDFE